MSIFTENDIIVFACLTFGYLDTESGLNPELVNALERLSHMGFVARKERPGLTTWTLREVPPMAEDAVAERVRLLDKMANAESLPTPLDTVGGESR